MTTMVGREIEIKLFERLSNFGKAVLIAIYGRRRVGKTFLVRRQFREKGIFFELTGSKKASKSQQLKNFHRVFISMFADCANLAEPQDWDEAFDRLQQATLKIDSQQKKSTDNKLSFIWPMKLNNEGPLSEGVVG